MLINISIYISGPGILGSQPAIGPEGGLSPPEVQHLLVITNQPEPTRIRTHNPARTRTNPKRGRERIPNAGLRPAGGRRHGTGAPQRVHLPATGGPYRLRGQGGPAACGEGHCGHAARLRCEPPAKAALPDRVVAVTAAGCPAQLPWGLFCAAAWISPDCGQHRIPAPLAGLNLTGPLAHRAPCGFTPRSLPILAFLLLVAHHTVWWSVAMTGSVHPCKLGHCLGATIVAVVGTALRLSHLDTTGRRDDRKQARMKYLVNEWGVPKFRSVVEQYLGKKFQPFRCGCRPARADLPDPGGRILNSCSNLLLS